MPSDRIEAPDDVDGVLALGGGSAIDTAKAPSAARGLPVVSVPTTYSGSEWTHTFGVRDPGRKMVGGGGGARMAGSSTSRELTLDLPRVQTGGTALNALAHTPRRSTRRGHTPEGDERALEGARLIADVLPRVLEQPDDLELRTHLLEVRRARAKRSRSPGSRSATRWRRRSAGRTGAHGTSNAICLPAALRFNAAIVPDAVRRFGEAIGAPDDPAAKVTSSRRSRGRRGCATSACPRTTCRTRGDRRREAGQPGEPAARHAGGSDRALRSVW